MIVETAALIALVLKNCVDVIKDVNSASEESKSLWKKVRSLFSKNESVKQLEANPDSVEIQKIVASELQKKLDDPSSVELKNQLTEIVSKLQPLNKDSLVVTGDSNNTILNSSNVSINVKNNK